MPKLQSTEHLKGIKKGQAPTYTLKIDRNEHPEIDEILKAENRMILKKNFGISLNDDEDWPSEGRFSDRMIVLLKHLLGQGEAKKRKQKGARACKRK